MAKKLRIAFDLDGVIVDKPPFIPKPWLERLFRGGPNHLHFHFPQNPLEQALRRFSHFYLFRPPIWENLTFINKIATNPQFEVYIISGRYSFLAKETAAWIKKWRLSSLFQKIFLNTKDEPPHLFKERILRELKPAIFIDDDKEVVEYLGQKLKKIKFLFFQKNLTPPLKETLSLK